jgi:thiosulfate/3-mercaptopyruvate sulfurtransferase
MNPLVTPTWLSARLQNPNIIILDATLPPVGVTPPIDTRARYLDKHIPGALFFDIEELSDHSTPLPNMLPTPKDFSRACPPSASATTAGVPHISILRCGHRSKDDGNLQSSRQVACTRVEE